MLRFLAATLALAGGVLVHRIKINAEVPFLEIGLVSRAGATLIRTSEVVSHSGGTVVGWSRTSSVSDLVGWSRNDRGTVAMFREQGDDPVSSAIVMIDGRPVAEFRATEKVDACMSQLMLKFNFSDYLAALEDGDAVAMDLPEDLRNVRLDEFVGRYDELNGRSS